MNIGHLSKDFEGNSEPEEVCGFVRRPTHSSLIKEAIVSL